MHNAGNSGNDNLLKRRKPFSWILSVFIIFFCILSACASVPGDPYTKFIYPSEMITVNDTVQGIFGGLGLYISRSLEIKLDGSTPYIEVVSLIEGSPGWLAGIKPGDLIISIDGEATTELTINEAMFRLRGLPGSMINLVIQREEMLEFSVSLKRTVIEVPTVKYAMIDNIGYLRISTFTPRTVYRTTDAINYFKQNNYNGIILDLRNNSGGLRNSAIEIASLFLEDGIVIKIKSYIPFGNRVFNTRCTSQVPPNIPVVVLINRGSASGSEIVAGALKGRGRAYLVGEQSFGKSSIQHVLPLGFVGLKITTAYYYTPENINIDKIGITPDLVVQLPELDDSMAEKLNHLIFYNQIYDLEYDIQLREAVDIFNRNFTN